MGTCSSIGYGILCAVDGEQFQCYCGAVCDAGSPRWQGEVLNSRAGGASCPGDLAGLAAPWARSDLRRWRTGNRRSLGNGPPASLLESGEPTPLCSIRRTALLRESGTHRPGSPEVRQAFSQTFLKSLIRSPVARGNPGGIRKRGRPLTGNRRYAWPVSVSISRLRPVQRIERSGV